MICISMRQDQLLNWNRLMIRSLNECDILIDATGGDSFTDIYGLKKFIAIFLIKYFSIMAKPSVILAPQTIGPYSNSYINLIVNFYLRFVKQIFIRDELSKHALSDKLM